MGTTERRGTNRRRAVESLSYAHVSTLPRSQKASTLPQADGEQIGACLTCAYWNAETPRPEALVGQVALCVYPALKEYALIVSGSSACNKWKEKAGAGPDAKAYAGRGEEK